MTIKEFATRLENELKNHYQVHTFEKPATEDEPEDYLVIITQNITRFILSFHVNERVDLVYWVSVGDNCFSTVQEIMNAAKKVIEE